MSKLNIFTDGGARGNPGPAAIGILVVTETGQVLAKISRKIGVTTNNVAEYNAVVVALEWLIKNQPIILSSNQQINKNKYQEIHFYLDSTLVVNQLNGLFKIKNGKLQELLFKIKLLEQALKTPVYYQFIPREKNYIADSLVNQALDQK